jgi:hypothetical protein
MLREVNRRSLLTIFRIPSIARNATRFATLSSSQAQGTPPPSPSYFLDSNWRNSEPVAIEVLKKYEWNLEVACDNYFQNPEKWERLLKKSDGGDRIDHGKIDTLFDIYRGSALGEKLIFTTHLLCRS